MALPLAAFPGLLFPGGGIFDFLKFHAIFLLETSLYAFNFILTLLTPFLWVVKDILPPKNSYLPVFRALDQPLGLASFYLILGTLFRTRLSLRILSRGH